VSRLIVYTSCTVKVHGESGRDRLAY